MFAASLVVGVVSVVPLCAMAHGGPVATATWLGDGAKAKVRSEVLQLGDEIDPE